MHHIGRDFPASRAEQNVNGELLPLWIFSRTLEGIMCCFKEHHGPGANLMENDVGFMKCKPGKKIGTQMIFVDIL